MLLDRKPFVGMEETMEHDDDDKEVIDFIVGAVGVFGLIVMAFLSAL
jgi:hypothetical protein